MQDYFIKYHSMVRLPHGSGHKGRSIWARGDNVNRTGRRFLVLVDLGGGIGGHPGMLAWARERPNWWGNLRGGGRGQCDAGLLRGTTEGQEPRAGEHQKRKNPKKETKKADKYKWSKHKHKDRQVSIGLQFKGKQLQKREQKKTKNKNDQKRTQSKKNRHVNRPGALKTRSSDECRM